MKRIALVMTCCAMFGATATAEAAPYLGPGEACRTAGRIIYKEFTNIQRGSGPCYTQRRPGYPDQRLVDKLYRDNSGACWQTTMTIRKTWSGGYRYRILNDSRTRWSRCY